MVFEKPEAPQPPVLEVLDASRIRISWAPSNCAPPVLRYYVCIDDGISRKLLNPSNGALQDAASNAAAGAVKAGTVSAVFSSASKGVKYRAGVVVENAAGLSRLSNLSNPICIENPEAPGKPTLEVIDNSRIRISWTASKCSPPALQYVAMVEEGGSRMLLNPSIGALHEKPPDSAVLIGAETTSVVLSSARIDVVYRAAITVKSAMGFSSLSELSSPATVQKPQAPRPPVLEVLDASRIRISWAASICTPPTLNYYVCIDDGVSQKLLNPSRGTLQNAGSNDAAGAVKAGTVSAVFSSASKSVKYRAGVVVENAADLSDLSSLSNPICIEDPGAPSKPTLEVIDNSRIRISWTASKCSPPALQYVVMVEEGGSKMLLNPSTGALHTNPSDSAVPIGAETTSVVLSSTRIDNMYRAAVMVKNVVGFSSLSELSSPATVQKLQAPQPPVLEVLDASRIRISWAPPPHEPANNQKQAGINRLAVRNNVKVLHHATRESNAKAICYQKSFRPGTRGFLGPGIYFSLQPSNARRWCQCRSGHGPIVVLRCEVNLGRMETVERGYYTATALLQDGYDSYKENGRDCYMLPNNDEPSNH